MQLYTVCWKQVLLLDGLHFCMMLNDQNLKVIQDLLLIILGAEDDALPLHIVEETQRHSAFLPGCLHPTGVTNP
jgi:hypothetical protein